METAKEKAIREAYGEHWEKVKQSVNDRGWFNAKPIFGETANSMGSLNGIELETMDFYHPQYCYFKRPKSLSGIENNNGWIRIESVSDLPKEEGQYKVWRTEGKEGLLSHSCFNVIELYEKGIITHYKPIKEEKPPIY